MMKAEAAHKDADFVEKKFQEILERETAARFWIDHRADKVEKLCGLE